MAIKWAWTPGRKVLVPQNLTSNGPLVNISPKKVSWFHHNPLLLITIATILFQSNWNWDHHWFSLLLMKILYDFYFPSRPESELHWTCDGAHGPLERRKVLIKAWVLPHRTNGIKMVQPLLSTSINNIPVKWTRRKRSPMIWLTFH